MHVVATAGHVDHGKSTLVRALTGIEPDRLAEERRRGMTIDLGFAWTTLPQGVVAFVDVPGHERFVTTMLAGVGAVPAVMLVVAADEGWMPQTEEHVAAAVALGSRHLLLVVTKADLGDAGAVADDALRRLTRHGLGDVPHVAVSAATGAGLDGVRAALGDLVAALPAPDPGAPVRLWVDRAFTIRGAGTVVTGTLAGGRIAVGDALTLLPDGREVVVRGMQSLGEVRDAVDAVARVALNLRGVDRDDVRRGDALVTPGAWTSATVLDALADATDLPAEVVAHVGAAAVPARVRRLSGRAARVQLATALPLHLGDRVLLRDPASRRIAGATVADLDPPSLRRRGDAARLAGALAVPASAEDEVARRGVVAAATLRRAGLPSPPATARQVGEWWVARPVWDRWLDGARSLVTADPAASVHGVPLTAVARHLGLPAPSLAPTVAASAGLVCRDGRVWPSGAAETPVAGQLAAVVERLAHEPLSAPDAAELSRLGADRAELAAAVRAGLLVRVADGVYVGPAAVETALDALAGLPSPFTVSDARRALGASRRVVVPLLEHLDAARRTRRLPDGTRLLVQRAT